MIKPEYKVIKNLINLVTNQHYHRKYNPISDDNNNNYLLNKNIRV